MMRTVSLALLGLVLGSCSPGEPVPEELGWFAVEHGSLVRLEPPSELTPSGELAEVVWSIGKPPEETLFDADVYFLVHSVETRGKVESVELTRLAYGNTMTATEAVKVGVIPFEDNDRLFKIVPREQLEPGPYALHFGELRAARATIERPVVYDFFVGEPFDIRSPEEWEALVTDPDGEDQDRIRAVENLGRIIETAIEDDDAHLVRQMASWKIEVGDEPAYAIAGLYIGKAESLEEERARSEDLRRFNVAEEIIEEVRALLNKQKYMQAVISVRSIGISVMIYSVDSGGTYPVANDIAALAKILEPTFIKDLPETDPWGTPFEFDSDGDNYAIRSYGSDGKRDDTTPGGPSSVEGFDVIHQNDELFQWPAGIDP